MSSPDFVRLALQLAAMLSLALAELGDVDGAVAAAKAALDREAHPYVHPCEAAALRTNLAWVSMLGVEAGLAARVPDPEAELLAGLLAELVGGVRCGVLEFGHD